MDRLIDALRRVPRTTEIYETMHEAAAKLEQAQRLLRSAQQTLLHDFGYTTQAREIEDFLRGTDGSSEPRT